jgi:hypothetical protein
LSELMGVLLPGGVAAGAVMLFQAWKSWREGKRSQEETAIERWQRLVQEAEERRDLAEQDEANAIVIANYWRQRAADLEYAMRSEGITVPPPQPMPTKRRMRGVRSGSNRRALRAASVARDEQDVGEVE